MRKNAGARTAAERCARRLALSRAGDACVQPARLRAASAREVCAALRARAVRVVALGMNPGPFGMAQTGVPFGEVAVARDWLGVAAPVTKPAREHPKRPVEGFACARSEVSGARLWGAVRAHWKTPARFFAEAFVLNYCPLVFMTTSGRNLTPDKCRAPCAQNCSPRVTSTCARKLRCWRRVGSSASGASPRRVRARRFWMCAGCASAACCIQAPRARRRTGRARKVGRPKRARNSVQQGVCAR